MCSDCCSCVTVTCCAVRCCYKLYVFIGCLAFTNGFRGLGIIFEGEPGTEVHVLVALSVFPFVSKKSEHVIAKSDNKKR